jgi:hypothetical protein
MHAHAIAVDLIYPRRALNSGSFACAHNTLLNKLPRTQTIGLAQYSAHEDLLKNSK